MASLARRTVCLEDYCPDSATRKEATEHEDSWYIQPKYSLGVAMGLTAILGIVIVLQFAKNIATSKRARRLGAIPGLRRIAALFRATGYHRMCIFSFELPSTFAVLLLFFLFIWTTAWSFAIKPYYRPGMEWGSPPLGLRSGYMAQAMIPFVFALGSRVNPISLLTGIAHERLQVYHQYGARIILFLSFVHTLPFLVGPYRQGGARYVKAYWYSSDHNWNGAASLAALVWIVFSSFAKFRKMNYEFFVFQHIVSFLVFLVFMFLHCNVSIPDALYYLYVSVGALAWSFFGRILIMLWANEFRFSRATVEALPAGMTRLTIETPLRWTAGQHVYLRLPTINPLQSHPFTVASLPSLNLHSHSNTLVLLARTRSGITRRLASGGLKSGAPILIDGPYGGLPRPMESYDTVLLVAGGAGATFVVGVLLQLVRAMEEGAGSCREVKLVWAVKDEDCIAWFAPTFERLSQLASFSNVSITVHATGHGAGAESSVEADADKSAELDDVSPALDTLEARDNASKPLYRIESGRPDVPALLREAASTAPGTRLGIAVCGPPSLNFDATNAAAALELDLARGALPGKSDVWLHAESFAW